MAMKKIYLLVLVTLAVAGCQKDSAISCDKLYLSVEGMRGGEKLAVEGAVSYWASGDRVRINEEVLTVSIDESAGTAVATSSGMGFSTPYRGVYPSSIYSGNSDKEHYTLNLPANYTYATTTHYSRTLQNLQAPMVAYTDEGTNLKFKHVTGAVAVQVVNYYGFTIEVDSIVVTSTVSEGNAYNLCGMTAVTLSNGDPVVNANRVGVDSTKSVKMKFNGADHLQIFAGDSAVVQIPVLPVGDGNKFNVLVGVHKVDQSDVKKNFVRTQTTGGAMPRAKMGYARFTTGGLFTVNASGKKVIISQGNLQWTSTGTHTVMGGGTGSGTWRFALNQYDVIAYNESDYRANTNGNYIDFFGWGTSGYHNNDDEYNTRYYPYSTAYSQVSSYNKYGYGPSINMEDLNLTGTSANYDWGVYNAIYNGGDEPGRWRTLTGNGNSSEWYYLFNTRGGTKYVNAQVAGVNGKIVFPDDYSHPGDVTALARINSGNDWNDNMYDEASWDKMEAAGAVFLPVNGNRSSRFNSTIYWSASYRAATDSYYLTATKGTPSTSYNMRYMGYAVRLVRDVN